MVFSIGHRLSSGSRPSPRTVYVPLSVMVKDPSAAGLKGFPASSVKVYLTFRLLTGLKVKEPQADTCEGMEKSAAGAGSIKKVVALGLRHPSTPMISTL